MNARKKIIPLGLTACLIIFGFSGKQEEPRKPQVVFIGDSTVKIGGGANGQWGWGEQIACYFDTMKITVVNRARGGQSSRTFVAEGLWKQTLSLLQSGDYLLIQFGHNDGGPIDARPARGSLRGVGEESKTVLVETTGEPETVYSFGHYLRQFVREAKVKGVTPVLLSHIPRNIFENGKVVRNAATYGGWTKQIADEEGVGFIDLNESGAVELEKIAAMENGRMVIDSSYFKRDHTHTSLSGAKLNARLVVEGIKSLDKCALKEYLLERTYTFGKNNTAAGINVSAADLYRNGKGYGFDLADPPSDANGAATSAKPFFFSTDLPEGDYDVTVQIGNPTKSAEITVRGESRRLFLEKIKTGKGEFVEQSFTVNVRNKHISANRDVRLKPREGYKLNWDDKLTIEFNGVNPGVRSIRICPAKKPLTIFLCGNSTVVDQDNEPWCAWGQMIPRFFQQGVSFANYAESGEAGNTFIAAGRLSKLLTQAKAGDYMFVEFGHNDMKQQGEGRGPWLSYTESLRTFVVEARKRGMHPVLVTPMHRRNFDENGKVVNTFGEHPAAMRKLAADENVPLIDLNKISETLYEAWGPKESVKAFVHYPAGTFPGQARILEDNTHFNSYGGYQLAKCIIEGIKDKGFADILQHLRPDYKAFDPAHPDDVKKFSLPPSPFTEIEKPDGN
ncbi:MAG: rhamnogalacturonan acetylesterase [Bacteroidales bacterium]|jgi:lysophospholipase L1-like esterase|nr:rhamnogalacturonan acetylesterase [Bacteroidales bacterium]